MNERSTFTSSHSFLVVSLITMFYLLVPGLLEAVSSGLKSFQENNGLLTFIIWFNLWLGTILFLYSKEIKSYFKGRPSDKPLLLKICNSLASLRFTVYLLGLSLILVFVGTLAQTEMGIWDVVDHFFRCFFSRVKLSYFWPWEVSAATDRLIYFFPGGYTLGILLLCNLLAAHSLKFKITKDKKNLVLGLIFTIAGLAFIFWAVRDGIIKEDIPSAYVNSYKRVLYRLLTGLGSTTILLIGCWFLFKKRAGIVVLHFGIILLLFSELITGVYAKEGNMRIQEGDYSSFVDLSREYELAISDPEAGASKEKSFIIPDSYLQNLGEWQSHESLPFDFKVNSWHGNATMESRDLPDSSYEGLGSSFRIKPLPKVSGVDANSMDIPAMEMEFRDKSGKALGKFAFSVIMYMQGTDDFIQHVTVGEKKYNLMMRNKREYLYSIGSSKPVRVKLIDFRHDTYIGTNVPKNYSSLVELVDEEKEIDRKVLISMNNPLRYTGRTFYQSSFAPDETGTVLQVVSNPGWMLPYLCCVIVGIGMLFQFVLTLSKFISRKLA